MKRKSARQATEPPRTDPAVVEFLRDLEHPRKKDIEAVRQMILDAHPAIGEGLKWNAPSFRTSEYFATFFLRATDSVQLIFHMGAKVKDNSTKGLQIPDPEGMLQWLAKERCIVTLGAGKELAKRRGALQEIVRAWIRQM
jgi:hypothetical protein